MNARRILTTAALVLSVGALSRAAERAVTDQPDGPQVVREFLQSLKDRGDLTAEKLAAVETAVNRAAQQTSHSEALTQGLILLYPQYEQWVRSAEEADDTSALAPLRELTENADRYLAADASFYLARALVNQERFEEALPHLLALAEALSNHTAHHSSIAYFLGVVHAGMLNNEQAIVAWIDFLDRFPDAPERLRVSAWRQVQQLQSIQTGKLDDVHQRMDFSRRRLEIVEPGVKTQEEQDKIVKLLAKLIKEEEKKECSASSGKSAQQQQQQQAQKQQSQPQQQSQSQQGGQSNVANGRFIDRNFDAGMDSDWSRLRDRSRDTANAGLKDKLPARYRDIVERYFDAVNNDNK